MRAQAPAGWWPSSLSYSVVIVGAAILGIAPLAGWALASESWLIFMGLAVIAVLPIIVAWPVISTVGLYAVLAIFLDAFPLLPGSSVTKPIGVLAGATLVAAGLVERRLRRPPPAVLWWGLLLGWAMLSAAWALRPGLVFTRLPTAVSLFVLYLVGVSYKPTKRDLYWVCVLTVLGGVMAAISAYFFGFNEQAATVTAARGRLVLGDLESNPNTLGRVLLLPLAIAIVGFVRLRGTLEKGLALSAVAVISVGIYTSVSRSAVLAALAMLAVLFYRIHARKYVFGVMLLLLALLTMMPDVLFHRFAQLSSGQDATGSGRTEIWTVGLEALQRFGFYGAGLENFVEVYISSTPLLSGGKTAHNTYLMVFVELGAVGLILMLGGITSHLLALWKARKAGHDGAALTALEAASWGSLISAMFGDQIWSSKSFWLIWMLLVWAIRYEAQTEDVSKTPTFAG